ncbi:calcium-binding protein [Geminicoccus flavidas]|uniref:calcium-binding protein n=1 Tax=Geminicoccus flavidas TaxID=2506407 RepID=UPI0013567FA4|nr:hypothetical protein [Geminicoccus flavidas]
MANLTGTDGPDTIRGTLEDDIITGRKGDDELYGEHGGDLINGRAGEDLLVGDLGNDRLHGGAGNDRMFGGEGDDRMWGDAGNDEMHGDEGSDILLGRDGNDELWGDNVAGWPDDGRPNPHGNDVLIGGIGDDILHGGEGRDTMIGNHGADIFQFDFQIDPQLSDDGRLSHASTTIADFVRGVDKLVITQQTNEMPAEGPPEVITFHAITFDDLDTDDSGQIDGLDAATDVIGGNLAIDVYQLGTVSGFPAFDMYFGGTITLQGVTELRQADLTYQAIQ